MNQPQGSAGIVTQMEAGLRFAPALPWWALAGLAVLAVAVLALAATRRPRGLIWRAGAVAVLLGWLCGPTLIEEHRTRLPDIAVLVVDQTDSMTVADRQKQARAAMATLQSQAAAMPALELRTVTVSPGGQEGTRLFEALDRALAGLARDRVAAVIALTDGQVHDVPTRLSTDASVPLHVLLTGHKNETDRRLRLIEAPGYGVVGKSVTLRIVVDDLGGRAAPEATATVTLRRDGEKPQMQSVPVGVPTGIELPISHEGPSIVELTAATLPGEVSTVNNRAVLQVTGVRDRLRVLLVSGEPHAGERTWRRLLKADPSVDLVHFTILRPPEKDDLTPLNELALIAFPTRELFQQKVREFDLIILDRFQNRGILPLPYLRNIAEYVRQGGGLLVSVGPEFAGIGSLDDTPLRSVLPAHPAREAPGEVSDENGDGAAINGPFRPEITAVGGRHPVTAELPGGRVGAPATWGHWYRHVPATDISGQVLMTAPDADKPGSGQSDAPLLLLDRVGAGRVALLLSDQIWLWARGHDGGGPQVELMRRIAHWLMKQPDLEENAIEARIEAAGGGNAAEGRLIVTRRSLNAAPPASVTAIDPSGQSHVVTMAGEPTNGTSVGSLSAAMPGVWQVTDGERSAYAAAAAANPKEIEDLRATDSRLAALARDSGGSVHWLGEGSADGGDRGLTQLGSATPSLRSIDPGRVASGRDWIGVPSRDAHVTSSIATTPLLPSWLALVLLLGSVGFAWWREST